MWILNQCYRVKYTTNLLFSIFCISQSNTVTHLRCGTCTSSEHKKYPMWLLMFQKCWKIAQNFTQLLNNKMYTWISSLVKIYRKLMKLRCFNQQPHFSDRASFITTPCFKKTSTHIIGYKLRNSCPILIIFDIKIPHIIWHRKTA